MIKYTIPYKSYDESEWRVDIDIPGYTGDPIFVNGKVDSACKLTYNGPIDNPWESPIVNVDADIALISTGQIDVQELQLMNDQDCKVRVYRNNEIKFDGYLIADGIQWIFQSAPYEVQLRATSGLNLLDGITYAHDNLEGGRTPLNYFRRILQSDRNLGINLPIRWSTRLKNINSEIGFDLFTKLKWAPEGEGFTNFNGETKSCGYIIEGLCKALQCRIFQADGAWWILDIFNAHDTIIEYKQCINSTGEPIITTHNRSLTKIIGEDYGFAREDAVIIVAPALGSCKVIYEKEFQYSSNDEGAANVLPNGNFDNWYAGMIPMHWRSPDNSMLYSRETPINGRPGDNYNSIQLRKGFDVSSGSISIENGGVPIDGNIYNTLSWGFTFLAVSGFPTDSEGYIDWSKGYLKASVRYTLKDENGDPKDFFLNSHGYWTDKNMPASAEVANFGIATIDNDKKMVIEFKSGKNFEPNDEVVIIFMRNGNREEYQIAFDTPYDVAGGVTYLSTQIPNSYTNDRTLLINNVQESGITNAFTRKTQDFYKYIYFSTQDKLRVDDVVNFEFRGRMEVKLPDPGVLNENTDIEIGKLNVSFIADGAQNYIIDDAWLKLNDASVEYLAYVSNSGKPEEYRLKISTAFSGCYVSNIMETLSRSNEFYLFTDGGYTGDLTALYARSIMRYRHKPQRIFNGTISVRDHDWSFLDNYKILSLSPPTGQTLIASTPTSYNTETNEVNLIAIEGNISDGSDITVKKLNVGPPTIL